MTQTQPLSSYNPFDPELLQDPYAYFERCRNEAPVFRDPNTGLVYISTYEMVREATENWRVFSNAFQKALQTGGEGSVSQDVKDVTKGGYPPVDTMLTLDPPDHARYRKLAMQAFNMKRVMGMTDYIAETINGIIDEFIEDGRCEFKSQCANELPMRVIADQLGVPRRDMDTFREWSNAFIDQLGGLADEETKVAAAKKIFEYQQYFVKVIEEKRANPTDDLISDLVHATLEDENGPRELDMAELLSMIQQILVAGNETTAHTLTAGIFYLLTNPDQFEALKADDTLIPNFVEEVLRFLSPTNNMWRVCTQDTVLGGVEIPAGSMCLLRYGSANRDGQVFEDGEKFDLKRSNADQHFAFGHGIHTCLGAQLARKEMNVAFPIILDRLKNIRFAEGKNTFRYAPNILLRGVEQMHVEFDT